MSRSSLLRLFETGLHNFRVVLGDSNLRMELHGELNFGVQSRDIQEVIIHENYAMRSGIHLNDIGESGGMQWVDGTSLLHCSLSL